MIHISSFSVPLRFPVPHRLYNSLILMVVIARLRNIRSHIKRVSIKNFFRDV